MANITINTISFSDMTELNALNDSYEVMAFKGNEARVANLQTLRRTLKPGATLIVTAPTGSKITLSKDDMSFEGTGSTVTFNVPEYGTWTITAELGDDTTSVTLVVDTIKIYRQTITF